MCLVPLLSKYSDDQETTYNEADNVPSEETSTQGRAKVFEGNTDGGGVGKESLCDEVRKNGDFAESDFVDSRLEGAAPASSCQY